MKKFLLFLCFLAYSNLALAKDDIQLKNAGNVKILRTTPQAEQILDLQFQSRELEVTSTLVEGEKKDSVVLNGKYDQPGGTLKVNKKQLKLAPDGSFKLKFRLKSPATDLVFTAVSKDGVEHNETISIAASGALASSTPKVFHTQVFNLGVGFSLISYSDRNYSSYTEKAITAKLSLGTQLTYSWSWGINAFVTALPISKSGSITARYVGANVRIGYLLSSRKSPWKFSLMGGAYYLTMIVSSADLGFKNMMGPQLYPYLLRVFQNGNSLQFYAKYSPVGNGFKILSLSNREIAAGGAYAFGFKNGHALSITADLSMLQLTFPNQANDLIKTTSITFGLGYGI